MDRKEKGKSSQTPFSAQAQQVLSPSNKTCTTFGIELNEKLCKDCRETNKKA